MTFLSVEELMAYWSGTMVDEKKTIRYYIGCFAYDV